MEGMSPAGKWGRRVRIINNVHVHATKVMYRYFTYYGTGPWWLKNQKTYVRDS
jgi:hypothetical protein